MRSFVFLFTGIVALSGADTYQAWRAIGPWGGSARVVRLDTKNPNNLMALAMHRAGVFRSRDGAQSWTELTHFPSLPNARLDSGIIIHAPNPQWLVGAAPGGLWRSRDEGDTWQVIPGTERLSVYALAAWAKDQRVLAAGTNEGVWISHDSANTWRRISPKTNEDLTAVVSVAFDPLKAGTIYAGTPHLPWKTIDAGVTWKKIHVGMYDDSDIFSIAVDPTREGRVFASACSGIYCSMNAGAAWLKVQGIPGTNRRTFVVAQSPHNPQLLFAGTSAGFWTSIDAGAHWSKLNENVVTSIAFHPTDSDTFYVSTDGHGLMRTVDGGSSFTSVNRGFVSRSPARLISKGSSIIATTPDGRGFQADSSAFDWLRTEMETPPPDSDSTLQNGEVFQRSVNPFQASEVLEASRLGLRKSSDGGKSWRKVDSGLGPEWIGSVVYHPKWKNLCYALRRQRVFWSRDGGEQWYWLPANEEESLAFQRLYISEAFPTILFGLSPNRGIYAFGLRENPVE